MFEFGKLLGAAIVVLGTVILLSFVLCLPVMWIWNWIMPELFGLATVTWTQAWGLNLLCGLLFRAKVEVNNKN